jgi:hypothetical protein
VSAHRDRARKGRGRLLLVIFAILLVLAVAARAALPRAIKEHVNRKLDAHPVYSGGVETVRLQLLRGTYSVHNLEIHKRLGAIPVPYFSVKRLAIALEWKALANRRLVGWAHLEQPELNYIADPAAHETPSGIEVPWLEMINNLFPFLINRAVISDGSIHIRALPESAPLDIHLSEIEGTIEDLGNIRNRTEPLISRIEASGLVMGHAPIEFNMSLDPFSYRPTFHLATRILGLDVTSMNDLAMAYGKWDFKHGWLDFVLEMEAREGRFSGYAKPLFRNLEVFSLEEDLEQGNVIQLFWQAIVGATVALLTNPPRDQFGTLIPFSGDFSGSTTANLPATLVNILRNAFVRAYLPALQGQENVVDGIEFKTPVFADELAGVSP